MSKGASPSATGLSSLRDGTSLPPSGLQSHSAGLTTPGPWQRAGIAVESEGGRTIAIVSPDMSLDDKSSLRRMRDNANLIAAAPDMFEALEHIHDEVNYVVARGSDARSKRILGIAVAALAKARGESA